MAYDGDQHLSPTTPIARVPFFRGLFVLYKHASRNEAMISVVDAPSGLRLDMLFGCSITSYYIAMVD